MVPSEALCADQHAEDDQEHAAEGHALQQVARRLGDHRARRADPRHPPGRLAEAADVARLEAEELDVLDAGGGLLGDLVALGVGGEADLAEAGEILARDHEDHRVARHQHHRGGERDDRLQHDQEHRDEARDHQVREQAHRRHEGLGDDVVDLRQHRLAEVGAVAVEEPGIGLAQVAAEQLRAQHVGAFVGEAGDRCRATGCASRCRASSSGRCRGRGTPGSWWRW